jgi:hypothetical protein
VGGELSQLHLSHGPKNLIVGKKNKRKFDLAYIYKNIKEIFIYTTYIKILKKYLSTPQQSLK